MDIQKRLQQIRENYARDLPGQVSDILKIWQQVINDPGNEQAISALFDVCHKLSGTGESFGFTLLSQHAGKIERYLRSVKEQQGNLEREQINHISELINLLPADINQTGT